MIPKCPKHGRIRDVRARPMNAAEKRHADRLAKMPCLVCGMRPVELHHVKDGPGGKRDHTQIAPLCPSHHRTGPQAVHAMSREDFNKLIGRNLLVWVRDQWMISEGMQNV